ncbi:MAG: diacylglycerol kinase [Alphaproteobacteria bacterium]|nr:diacylglycerol kinase [Alphaproteobacteria bacterium]
MKQDKPYHIYINQDAGTVQSFGKEALEKIISKSALPIERLHFLKPRSLIQKVKDHPPDLPFLIGGGDGTLCSCAPHLIETKKPFGILPFGTMNLLAKDLNIPIQLEKAIEGYARGFSVLEIDAGKVNNCVFLCCASLGVMPEASKFREKHRHENQTILVPRLTAYLLKQMDRNNHKELLLNLDGSKRVINTSALVISNNQYESQESWNGEGFKRKSLQGSVLGLYSAVPFTFWDKLRFLVRLGLGDWKRDNVIEEWTAKELHIENGAKQELVSLDGETKTLNMPLHFSIIPKSVRVLIPKDTSYEQKSFN